MKPIISLIKTRLRHLFSPEKTPIRLLGAIGLSLATAPLATAADDLALTRLNDTVYMLQGGGGNVGVSVGADGILLIDDKGATASDRVRAALARFGDRELKYVLNTHFHGDHTGGNLAFGPDVPIIAHANTRARLALGAEFGKRFIETYPPKALPTVTFKKSLSIHFNGEEIEVLHFPGGHTDGDIAAFFTHSNIVHLGDLFFNGRFPFVDLDYGGDVAELTRHIAALIDRLPDDVTIIPGHGELATLDDLKAYHRMLVATTASVRASIAAGRSLDEIKTAGLNAQWQAWDWAFVPTQRWLEILYWSQTPTRR